MNDSIFRRLLLFAGCAALPVWSQPVALIPGEPVVIEYPETVEDTLFNGDNGFIVDVPEGAAQLTIDFAGSPSETRLDLFARFGQDVELDAEGDVIADHRSRGPRGVEQINIDRNSVPPLEQGRYFIATLGFEGNEAVTATIVATLLSDEDIAGLTTVASSDFESGKDGWTINCPAPEPEVSLRTVGDPDSTLSVTPFSRGDSRGLVLDGRSLDSFVPPAKYLGNLALLGPRARLRFDLKHRPDDGFPKTALEVRMLGRASAFGWRGLIPTKKFVTYSAVFDESNWQRLGGKASFDEVLAEVLRFEIRGSFDGGPGDTTIDNVVLLGEVPVPAFPVVSDFEDGTVDGWKHNFPGSPLLIPRTPGATFGEVRASQNFGPAGPGGNPGGYLKVRDFDEENRDFFVAPKKFLGNLAALGPDARFEFDRFHSSDQAARREVEVRIVGFGGAYRFRGPLPTTGWDSYAVPLDPLQWLSLGGSLSFADTLGAVQRIEVSADEAPGRETAGLDNFQLLPSPSVTSELLIDPEELSFIAVSGLAPPPAQMIAVNSAGEEADWSASVSIPWLQLSQKAGKTPSAILVTVSPLGLGLGLHEGSVMIETVGSSDPPVSVAVSLMIVVQGTPLIFSKGVVNSADFTANDRPGGELAGGMFVSIFGESLASGEDSVFTVPFPLSLGGTSVTIGSLPAPIVFVSPNPLVVVVPQAVEGPTADVVVTANGLTGPAETVRVTDVRPVLFSQSQDGTGPGAIQNVDDDGSVQPNTFQTSAKPGQFITIFGTGFGPTQTPVADGFPATGVNRITNDAQVRIGSQSVSPSFVGLSPKSPHLYQSNAEIPSDTATGCSIEVQIVIDGVPSNVVTAAISSDGGSCQ